jgi:hypothetical protein
MSKTPEQIRKEYIAAFRQRSGNFKSNDPLTSLFYLIIRDHIKPGDLELIMQEITNNTEICEFTNGWLGQYAQDLAIRIYQAGEKTIKP